MVAFRLRREERMCGILYPTGFRRGFLAFLALTINSIKYSNKYCGISNRINLLLRYSQIIAGKHEKDTVISRRIHNDYSAEVHRTVQDAT